MHRELTCICLYSEFIFISYGYVAFHENSYMTKGEDRALQSSVLGSFMKGSAINVYVVDVERQSIQHI